MAFIKESKKDFKNIELTDCDINNEINRILSKTTFLIKSYILEKIDEIGYSNFVSNVLLKNVKITRTNLQKLDSITKIIGYEPSFDDYESLSKNDGIHNYFESKHNLNVKDSEIEKIYIKCIVFLMILILKI